jgi:lysozyme
MCKYIVDVSHHQGKMNWARAANAGVVAGVARATMGVTGKDEQFDNNWAAMVDNGILRGAYHLFLPQYGGKEQADWFMSVVKDAPSFYAVADVELNTTNVTVLTFRTRLFEFYNTVEAQWPATVVVYTRASFWNPYLGPTPFPAKLWVANYTNAPKPLLPKSWSDWLLWQYSADGNNRGAEFGAESCAIDLSRCSRRL